MKTERSPQRRGNVGHRGDSPGDGGGSSDEPGRARATVVVTRPRGRAGPMIEALRALEIDVLHVPVLEVAPPTDPDPLERAAGGLDRYDWVAFTSATAVRALARCRRHSTAGKGPTDRLPGDGGADSAGGGAPAGEADSAGGGPAAGGADPPRGGLWAGEAARPGGGVPAGEADPAEGGGVVDPSDPADDGRRPRIAAVGPATARAVQRLLGAPADLVPDSDYSAEGLVEAFRDRAVELEGRRVLLPLAEAARDVLPAGLAALGARVDRVVAYRTVVPEGAAADELRRALRSGGVHLLTFTSPSTAENLLELVGEISLDAPAAAIGPVTAEAARALGYRVVAVAEAHTVEGLVEAAARHLAGAGPRGREEVTP